MSILFNRSVVLAKLETTFGVDPSPTGAADALLVENPDFSADLSLLERTNVKFDISPDLPRIGRKVGSISFLHEVRNNGNLDGTTPPLVGRLLQACGMLETAYNGAATLGTPVADSGVSAEATGTTFAKSGTSALTQKSIYKLTVVAVAATPTFRVTGGNTVEDTEDETANGNNGVISSETFTGRVFRTKDETATTTTVDVDSSDPLAPSYTIGGTPQADDIVEIVVLGLPFQYTVLGSDATTDIAAALRTAVGLHAQMAGGGAGSDVDVTFSGEMAGVVVTDAVTEVTLGDSTCKLTPDFTDGTNYTLGDAWTVTVHAEGYEYTPVSDDFKSVTIYAYFDGLLHKLTGSRGTFTVEGNGGELAKFNFTFTGNFEPVADAETPATPNLETTVPPQVELADLQIDGGVTALCAGSFGIDMANNVVIRECINKLNAYDGVEITARAPAGSMDPEAVLESAHDFWNRLSTGTAVKFNARVGSVKGNIVRFEAPNAQYSELTYGNRNEIRVYEVGLRFARTSGNDELKIQFT